MLMYAFLLLFFLLIYYQKKSSSYWKNKGIPFEPPFLFFGSFFNIVIQKQSIFERLGDIYVKYKGPYVGLHIFTTPFLMLRDPTVIKTVLVKDFDKFMNRGNSTNEAIDPISFHNLFSAEGQTWRSLRHKLSPVFSAGKIKLMFPIMENCSKNMIKYLTNCNRQIIDVKTVMKKYSVDVISSCAFGVDGNCWSDEDSPMVAMATQLIDLRSVKRNVCTFSYFFIPALVNIFKLTAFDKDATNFMLEVFKSSLKERKEMNICRNDFIDLIYNLEDGDYKFDEIIMAAQAILFFVAGNITSTITKTFALYEMATHKDIQSKVREEVINICGGDNITYEHIQEMKYLDMVLCESMRKHPVIAFLNRKSVENYTFENTGLTLEKNTNILVPIYGLHHDPEYFPEPDRFIPERFSEENRKNIKSYTYLPFGEGPRNCIGQRFGTLSVKLCLAYFVKNFKFELPDEKTFFLEYDAKSFLLESKTNIRLKITKI